MPTLATTARDDARLRFRVFSALVIGVVAFLGARLVQMQIVDREEYTAEGQGQRHRDPRSCGPARGYIFDRNGILMVDNETTVSVTVAPRYFDEDDLPLVAELAGAPLDQLRQRYAKIVKRSAYQEDVILENVPFWTFARLQENQYRLRGIAFREDQQRRYHGQARLTHALGYVNEIGASQLDEMREQGYRLGDRVGKTGIELEYEAVLRGRVGARVRAQKRARHGGRELRGRQPGRGAPSPARAWCWRSTPRCRRWPKACSSTSAAVRS